MAPTDAGILTPFTLSLYVPLACHPERSEGSIPLPTALVPGRRLFPCGLTLTWLLPDDPFTMRMAVGTNMPVLRREVKRSDTWCKPKWEGIFNGVHDLYVPAHDVTGAGCGLQVGPTTAGLPLCQSRRSNQSCRPGPPSS